MLKPRTYVPMGAHGQAYEPAEVDQALDASPRRRLDDRRQDGMGQERAVASARTVDTSLPVLGEQSGCDSII